MTPLLLSTLDYIEAYAATHGYSPTMQEIADHFGVTKVTVFERVGVLERDGKITRDRHKTRCIRLVNGDPKTLAARRLRKLLPYLESPVVLPAVKIAAEVRAVVGMLEA